MMENNREVHATLGVVEGGIAINWDRLGFPTASDFSQFLTELLLAMGFLLPRTVRIARNKEGGRIDWRRLRISEEECCLHQVLPHEAVGKARAFLEADNRLKFKVVSPPLVS